MSKPCVLTPEGKNKIVSIFISSPDKRRWFSKLLKKLDEIPQAIVKSVFYGLHKHILQLSENQQHEINEIYLNEDQKIIIQILIQQFNIFRENTNIINYNYHIQHQYKETISNFNQIYCNYNNNDLQIIPMFVLSAKINHIYIYIYIYIYDKYVYIYRIKQPQHIHSRLSSSLCSSLKSNHNNNNKSLSLETFGSIQFKQAVELSCCKGIVEASCCKDMILGKPNQKWLKHQSKNQVFVKWLESSYKKSTLCQLGTYRMITISAKDPKSAHLICKILKYSQNK